ncbi:MAG: hypothetical protein IPL71_05165 [Anaerolineales bacterium]|uniref:hypothetical protein n=1 Tax=Candidatus Villigracilis proximus TaxID=3140683 RepID=UPI0031372F59|nr:hypothetical protein [Anaerolineales bacterium]
MKMIFKVLVILVVAILVGGLFYGAVTASSSGTDQTAMSERPHSEGGFERHEGGESGGIQFPADAVKNLLIITVIATLYVNISRWIKKAGSVSTENPVISS